ncbi:unnamed protein product [Nezara viridula]|uniref:Uncharacterized protein n=1 Tax=Nezara viridula TaxID=85310 RepID=A0A9P0EF33_NEZVI|nr:unnamed protein product [Nezara viridula]
MIRATMLEFFLIEVYEYSSMINLTCIHHICNSPDKNSETSFFLI